MRSYLCIAKLLTCLLMIIGAGCSNTPAPPGYGSEDGKKIALLIEEVSENKSNLKVLRNLFVTPPTDVRPFGKYMYDVDGKPSVTGTTATASIKIRSDSGADLASQTWEFEKVGDQWKVKSAPLP